MRAIAPLLLVALAAAALPPVQAVDPLPDLVIEAGSFAPQDPMVGQFMLFTVTVRNVGGSASDPTDVAFAFDALQDGSAPLPSLQPGETAEVTYAVTAQPGTGSGQATANFPVHSQESDFGNNGWSFGVISVLPPEADAAVRIVGLEKAKLRTDFGDVPNPFGVRTITVQACNVGERALEHAFVTVLAQAAQGSAIVAPQHDVGALGVGDCVQESFTWSPVGAFGDVRFRAQVDATLDDVDFSNNVDEVEDFVVLGGLGAGVLLP